MRKANIIPGLILMLYCTGVTAQQPVVFSVDASALEKNKALIKAGNASLMTACTALLKDADKALDFAPVSVMEKKNDPPGGDKHDYMSLAPYFWPDPSKPNGLPYIRKDGETNPEVKDYKDKEYMPKLCEGVHTLALAYYFSGDNKYADHAAKLLRVWFLDKETAMNPNLNYAQAIKGTNDGRGAGIIDSRHLIKVTDAIGLLSNSKSWTASDQAGMKKWFSDFLNWMQTSKNGMDEMDAKNNHGVWYDAQCLSFALFTGNAAKAKEIVRSAQNRLDKQMDEDGFFPLEMARTTSMHYSCFVLEAFVVLAELAEKAGADLWSYTSPSGKSLKKAFDAYYPYLAKEKEWTGQQIKEFNFEEGIPLLAAGAKKFNCKNCPEIIKNIAAGKAPGLRIKLFTDIDF